jgi:hypothetical protein
LNPLLLSFYDDYESGAFSRDDFLSMLGTTESYVFRRAGVRLRQQLFQQVLALHHREAQQGAG